MGILKADNLVKIYGQGENEVKALNNVSLEIEEGEFVSIVGSSGSGKSTLLNMLGGLDSGHAAVQISVLELVGVAHVERDAVDAPRLTACPRAVIVVALTGCTVIGAAGLGIHIEGMECACVVTDDVLAAGLEVLLRDLSIMRVASDLADAIEQGDVQHTVDDEAVMLGTVERAPCLKELTLFLPAGEQLVGGQDGGALCLFASGQLVAADAGERVEEAEVVVVEFDLVLDTVQEAVHIALSQCAELFVAGVLVAQPQHASPETIGPFDVFNNRILQFLGCRPRKLILKVIHVCFYLFHTRFKRGDGFVSCNRRGFKEVLAQVDRFNIHLSNHNITPFSKDHRLHGGGWNRSGSKPLY